MRRVQWHRVDHAVAPQGHALTATISGQTWRAFERDDGRWTLEAVSPEGPTVVVGSLSEARDYAGPRGSMGRSRARRRKNNGAGLGAFLGSLIGVIAGGAVWPPLAVLGSIAGGAIGGNQGAKADRRKRGAVGGAVGGALLGPIGAAVGGYIGGRKPDATFRGERNPRQYEAAEWAEFVLDGMAQRDAKVTVELREAADAFELAVDEALDVCLDKFPPAVDPSPLHGDPATALDIFMTLSGEGVGIWDGRWDVYYPDAKPRHWNRLQSCLRSELKDPYRRLESALIDAAYVINDNPTRRLSRRLAKKVNI